MTALSSDRRKHLFLSWGCDNVFPGRCSGFAFQTKDEFQGELAGWIMICLCSKVKNEVPDAFSKHPVSFVLTAALIWDLRPQSGCRFCFIGVGR